MQRFHKNLISAANGVTGKVVFKKRITQINQANRRQGERHSSTNAGQSQKWQDDSLDRASSGDIAREDSNIKKSLENSRKQRKLFEHRPSTA